MTKPVISIATINDLEAITKLYVVYVNHHSKLDSVYYSDYNSSHKLESDLSHFTDVINNGTSFIIVSQIDNQIVGFLEINFVNEKDTVDSKFSKFAQICNLVVEEKYRHKGIGSEMVRFAEKIIKDKNYQHIKIQVSSFNDKALHLYRKLDYIDRQRFLYKTITSPGFIKKAFTFIHNIFNRK